MTAQVEVRRSFLNILPLLYLKYKATKNAFLKCYQHSILPPPLNNTFSINVLTTVYSNCIISLDLKINAVFIHLTTWPAFMQLKQRRHSTSLNFILLISSTPFFQEILSEHYCPEHLKNVLCVRQSCKFFD